MRNKALILSLMDRGVFALYGIAFVLAFARLLGHELYGIIVVAETIKIFLVTLSDTAVNQSLIKHIGQAGSDRQRRKVLAAAMGLKIKLYGFSIASMLALAVPLSHLYGEPLLAPVLALSSLHMLFAMMGNTATTIQVADRRMDRALVNDAVLLATMLIGIGFGLRYDLFSSPVKAMAVLICVRGFTSAAATFLCRKSMKGLLGRADRETRVSVWNFSKASFANSLGVLAYSKSDVLMIGVLASTGDVGLYGSAALSLAFFMILNDAVGLVVFPAVSRIDDSRPQGRWEIRKLTKKAVLISFLLGLPFSLALMLFPEPILRLMLGSEYTAAAGVLRLFGIWGLVLPVPRAMSAVLNGVGEPGRNARYTWIGALFNIALNVPFIVILGKEGAALASVSTSLVMLALHVNYFRHRFSMKPFATGKLGFNAEAAAQR